MPPSTRNDTRNDAPDALSSPASPKAPKAPDASPFARPAWGWVVVFSLIAVALAVVSLLGLASVDALCAVVFTCMFAACIAVSVCRPRLAPALRALAARRRGVCRPTVLGLASLFLAGAFAMLALEVPSNHDFSWTYPLCILLEWALLTALMSGLFFLCQRHGAAPAVLAAVAWVLGLAEYYIITFRTMPITPSDLTALTTAAAVSGGYDYTISAFCAYGLGFDLLAMLMCQVAGWVLRRPALDSPALQSAPADDARMPPRHNTRAWRVATNIIVGLLCFAGVAAHVTLIDYNETLGITVYSWRPLTSYYRQGFLPTFISEAQALKPPQPDDYDPDDAESLIESYAARYDEEFEIPDDVTVETISDASSDGDSTYADSSSSESTTTLVAENRAAATEQFDETQPTVIVVMNETFCDLSIYDEMHAGYDGPEFFNSIDDAVQRGTLYVSAFGGGTANTEFEFLCGGSLAYLGNGVYPYTIYDLTDVDNLASQFGELGYDTTAMHPNHADNWNRANAYADLGFDEFLDIDDFEGADKLRGMVTDEATYDKILELIEEDDAPQFIFDVTMQNHSGYKTGLVPYSMQEHLSIDGTSDAEVNEFVSLITESDRALAEFVGELEDLERDVVLVFFGDHQPFLSSDYNDLWFDDEDDATHTARQWQTSYVIWANYDVAGSEQNSSEVALSSNYLGTELLQLIGAPLSDYQKACVEVSEDLPAINSALFVDSAGDVYLKGTDIDSSDDEAAQAAEEARLDLWEMQYYQLFGDGKDVYTDHFQTEVNETNPNAAPGTTQPGK